MTLQQQLNDRVEENERITQQLNNVQEQHKSVQQLLEAANTSISVLTEEKNVATDQLNSTIAKQKQLEDNISANNK